MSIASANDYFSKRLWTEEWDNANDTKKEAAYNTAKNQIDSLSISNRFSNEDYKKSIYEQALFLLKLSKQDKERIKLQETGVKKVSLENISESYDSNNYARLCDFVKNIVNKYRFRTGELT